MKKTVNIPTEELECLREHLNEAFRILKSLGIKTEGETPSVKPKKSVPFQKGVNNYMSLLGSGKKRTLPKHLQTKKTTR